MLKKLPRKFHKGQILISILIAIVVFAILSHALFTLLASSYELVSFNKARITARHLAEENIELIRNMSYDDLGTVGGIPSGNLPQQQTVNMNGLNFTVKTSIVFVDDPFDGLAPQDTDPEDYKRVRIEVDWQSLGTSRANSVVLVSDVSPGQATLSQGGTLTILVFDSNTNPVSGAQVTVTAPSLNPPVNLTLNTDANGKINLPGTPACLACYHIVVTKSGLNTDRTYSTSEVTNPLKPDASILQGQVTQVSFAIDKTGTINISSLNSRQNNFAPIGNITFRMHGGKLIGFDAYDQPVYKYDQTLSTNSSGVLNITNMEWDNYTVSMPTTTSWDIAGTSPLQPLSLLPQGNVNFSFVVYPHSADSSLEIIKDPTQTLINSAYVTLIDPSGGTSQTVQTGASTDPDSGQAFFPNLNAQVYNLTATASAYQDLNSSVTVSGNTVDEQVMTPQ